MARVSVIVPAHDAEQLLGDALRSVEAQSYDDWEAIVADDASDDGTAAVAESFGPRVKVVRSERNVGPAAARNLALAQAGGELIALLDADDYWLPGYLETQVAAYDAAAAAGERVGLVSCDARILTPDGMSETTYHQVHHFSGELTLERLLERNPVFVSALFPRALLDETGTFDEDIRGAEDFDLWVRIMERGYTAVVTPEPLAVYRRWPGAETTSERYAARSERLAYERALERGRLAPRAERIARKRLRYCRAVKLVAEAGAPAGPERAQARRLLLRRLPLLVGVALTNPHYWWTWVRGAASRAFLRRRREYA